MGTENWFPIGCSDKFVGTTVPTKIVGTPNGGFLLAVPTNLSEQTTIYNSASCPGAAVGNRFGEGGLTSSPMGLWQNSTPF